MSWVDGAKGLSILLVVLLHTRLELRFLGIDSSVIDAIDAYGLTIRMPLFFAASGLFAAKWIRGSWRDLFRGKIAALAWVYLLWQPVVFVYKSAEMLLLPNQPANDWASQVGKLMLSAVRPNGELWFLWALCVFLVITKLLSQTPALVRVGIPAVVSLLWMTFDGELPQSAMRVIGDGWAGLPKFYFFFVAACVLSTHLTHVFSRLSRTASAIILLAWFAASTLAIAAGVDRDGAQFGLSILGVIAGFSGARLLGWVPGLTYIGRNTLPIYLTHTPIIVIIAIVLHLVGADRAASAVPGLTVAAVTAAATLGALTLHALLTRRSIGRLAFAPPAWFFPVNAEKRPARRS